MLGDRVECQGYLYQTKKAGQGFFNEKTWNRRNKRFTGVIAGVRTLKDGLIFYDSEEGFSFKPQHHIKTYLVAADLRTNYYVLPQDISKVEPAAEAIPELVEALKWAFEHINCQTTNCRAISNQVNHGFCWRHEKIYKALAKAKGE